MQLLGRHSAWVEVYSIDEAFLGVRGTLPELQALARRMKQDVMDHLGLPVCVGSPKLPVQPSFVSGLFDWRYTD
ncbi:nucleotidyltransferase/DNA polymerase involved in DNA repair [Paeniglutamicibacter psychrophenolicus]|nr:nucleotidyltransferase/DNA polymerase involved in DNA repair [Paeniglutamicibacter psychrophenolicus]